MNTYEEQQQYIAYYGEIGNNSMKYTLILLNATLFYITRSIDAHLHNRNKTVFGVASQAGRPVQENGLIVKCITTMLFASVSDSANLDWITNHINQYA